ncbi:MAG: DUF5688 family protein [Eubacterium sp.]|nr:DUF5688 family protein [Eubacterium sp.]
MLKEEFIKEVAKRLEAEYTSRKIQVRPYTMIKNNGSSKHGIQIQIEDYHACPTVYLDRDYDRFEAGFDSLEDVVTRVCDSLKDMYQKAKYLSEEDFSFENLKEKITYRLISTDLNEEKLKEMPHLPFLDFSIVFYALLNLKDQSVESIPITNSVMESWGVSTSELFDLADENTRKLLPEKVEPMFELIEEMAPEGLDLTEIKNEMPIFVLTNEHCMFGATSILYQGVMEKMADQMKSNLYVLPSSVHELIILPEEADSDIEDFREMICDVNTYHVEREDWLSDHAYFYNWEEKRFVMPA